MVGRPDRGPIAFDPPPPLAAPRRVATSAAFDLVTAGDGALLFFGPPSSDGGGLRVARLDALGGPRGPEDIVHSEDPDELEALAPYALEVAAAAGGGRVGVAWVARTRLAAEVRVTHGAEAAEVFAPIETLSPTETSHRIVRGTVAVAAAGDGTLGVFHRAGRGRCADGPSNDCVIVLNERLGGASGSSERGGLPLAIPSVCDGPVPGYVVVDGTHYYALCAMNGDTPETTLYAIRFEPRYAQADQVLAGAEPIGLARAGEGAVVVVARRGERIDAVRYANAGQERTVLEGVTRRVRCDGARPVFDLVPASGDTLSVAVTGPEARLEALLPTELAPTGSRAVWTGEALIVAEPLAREVAIHRHQCIDGELTRTDPL